MATATINPLGAVAVWDGENPRTFTGRALATVSGGDFVYVSGTTNTGFVGSQASSFKTTDLSVGICHVWAQVNGIALNNAGSGELVTIATRGTYLLKAGGAVSGGMLVTLVSGAGTSTGYDGVVNAGITAVGSWAGIIGRALTTAGSDYYCLVSLNL